ncbi:MAG TPA: hypothetical protein PK200_06500 [Spirochaetota bacterium]|nr:hypothetical protein [Spirochaetota bacterium]HQO02071.1 hypothetical protein [Spirochaetota bacterium]HQP47779.1 hypothetical protein [Spirochaetota bacterium]
MMTYYFWDIENVSFHNLERIMKHVHETSGPKKQYVVYSKIKESRKDRLAEVGWELVKTTGIYKNSADNVMKEMIESILDDNDIAAKKIVLITEDKGFYKISQQVIIAGIELEVICGRKDPEWIKKLSRN